MKKELLKYAAFFLMAVTAVAFTACEKDSDDDDGGEESVSIVGVWTIESVEIDASIAGVSLLDYLVSMGVPESQAQEMVDEMMTEMGDMTGTLELKDDGTYEANFSNDDPEEDDTGSWELTADKKTLYIDKGTDDEMEFEVVTLTKNALSVKMTQTEPMDGTSDEMTMMMTMNFTR